MFLHVLELDSEEKKSWGNKRTRFARKSEEALKLDRNRLTIS